MRIVDTDFLVKPGEVITVTVQAFHTRYLAEFSPRADWTIVSPPNPEVRTLTAPSEDFSFTVTFDFAPRADPAKYHVTIVGNRDEDTFPPPEHPEQGDVAPSPPFPIGQHYRFVVN